VEGLLLLHYLSLFYQLKFRNKTCNNARNNNLYIGNNNLGTYNKFTSIIGNDNTLLDNENSYIIGENNYVRITVPPGIWFGFKGEYAPKSLVLNLASITHDPDEVERLPKEAFNDKFL
jgi:hypothetical protein